MKEVATKFRGVFAFLVTPTKSGGEAIDLDRLCRFIDFQIEAGVDGITIFGSTGGIGSFTEDERRQVIGAAAKQVDGRVPLVAGTGAMQTSEAVRLSKFAEDVGADAVLIVPITYWPLTEDEVIGHFEAIAAATSLPIGLYNNPWTTGVDVAPAAIARIAEIDSVGFVKESSGDMTRVPAIKKLTGGGGLGAERLGCLDARGDRLRRRRMVRRQLQHYAGALRRALPARPHRRRPGLGQFAVPTHVPDLRADGAEGLHPRRPRGLRAFGA
jgi:dihydrodipicolinate synthase/N-acetylneuraminate lyase